jgi:N-acetyl-gamma-glutamyl-phosphate reductase
MSLSKLRTLVIGGSGYVAGELLRLLAQHPHFHSPLAISESKPGTRIADAFSHLAPLVGDQCFLSLEDAKHHLATEPCLILSAAPHGVSAVLLDDLIRHAEQAGQSPYVVDLSADYRLSDESLYERVYGHPQGAPQRLKQFICALPEHATPIAPRWVAHPGCFATAMLLSIGPLLKNDLTDPVFYCQGITGSTGSGRKLSEGTHHPRRHSDLYSYNALAHRHAPEVAHLLHAYSGQRPEIHFVPHSGPFARGIHMTVQARLKQPLSTQDLVQRFKAHYATQPFVQVLESAPRLKDVVGSHYAQCAVHSDGQTVAVSTVIDNLIKGAAGGGIQWANRLLGLDERTGLSSVAIGYT